MNKILSNVSIHDKRIFVNTFLRGRTCREFGDGAIFPYFCQMGRAILAHFIYSAFYKIKMYYIKCAKIARPLWQK